MTQDATQKQNIKWLKEQLQAQESKLAEAEALVVKLRASVAHFRGVLKVLVANEAELTLTEALLKEGAAILNESQVVANALAEDESPNKGQTASNVVFESKSIEDESRRNPQDMKLREHLGMTFAEAAQSVLDRHQKSHELKRILTRTKHSS